MADKGPVTAMNRPSFSSALGQPIQADCAYTGEICNTSDVNIARNSPKRPMAGFIEFDDRQYQKSKY